MRQKGMIMNKLQIFNNEEFGQVRILTINNEPWFVGKDVAIALGYKDTADALKKHVEYEDKLTRHFADSGQKRKMYIINESGLYALIFGSKLESAKRFKRWVTSEVLPAIRKTGGYQKPLSPVERLNLIQEATLEVNEKVEKLKSDFYGLKSDLDDFKENMPLLGVDMDALKKAVNIRVVDVLGGVESNAYKNRSVRVKVYSDCWNELKRQFGCVKSYKEMKRNQMDQALAIVKRYTLPFALAEMVADENAQISMDMDKHPSHTLEHQ